MARWFFAVVAAWRLRGFQPQRVTVVSLMRWANQFPREYRSDLLRLAAGVRFLSEEQTVATLLDLNAKVIEALAADGVRINNVIYIQTDAAASSSAVMLNLLRDRGNLERRGARLIDSKDLSGISDTTRALERGALIYVDDFSGTGKQFARSRRRVAQYVIGSFSEFFLLPCICEEAVERVAAEGVETVAGMIHTKSERPLREECALLPPARRSALVELSREHWGRSKVSLGFDGLATNIVFYRNAPNSTPLIFRGHLGQHPLRGILPRYDDLGAA